MISMCFCLNFYSVYFLLFQLVLLWNRLANVYYYVFMSLFPPQSNFLSQERLIRFRQLKKRLEISLQYTLSLDCKYMTIIYIVFKHTEYCVNIGESLIPGRLWNRTFNTDWSTYPKILTKLLNKLYNIHKLMVIFDH